MVRKNDTESNPKNGGTEFSEETLREFSSFDDVLRASSGVVNEISDHLGDGFSVLEDKSDLVGVEFMVVTYSVHPSESTGKDFTSLRVITRDGRKLIINDGSTGIHEQCLALRKRLGNFVPLHVRHGLRVSEYDYQDGEVKKRARTFYLSTSK